MSVIRWTETMSVGVESIDSDHRHLIGLTNRLDEAVRSGGGAEVVDSVLDEMLRYTVYHFDREEALMDACGYPDADAHRHTHQVLKTQVANIRDRHAGNPDTIHDREVLSFLRNWLTAHILGRDQLYAPFMAGRRQAVDAANAAFPGAAADQPHAG